MFYRIGCKSKPTTNKPLSREGNTLPPMESRSSQPIRNEFNSGAQSRRSEKFSSFLKWLKFTDDTIRIRYTQARVCNLFAIRLDKSSLSERNMTLDSLVRARVNGHACPRINFFRLLSTRDINIG